MILYTRIVQKVLIVSPNQCVKFPALKSYATMRNTYIKLEGRIPSSVQNVYNFLSKNFVQCSACLGVYMALYFLGFSFCIVCFLVQVTGREHEKEN